MKTEQHYRDNLVIGWIVLIHIVMLMSFFMLLSSGVANDFSALADEPGDSGLVVLLSLLAIYAVLPLLIKMVDHPMFRWILFGFSILCFLFFLAHQLGHMIVDKVPLTFANSFDLLHHIVMLVVIFINLQWARLPSKHVNLT